MIRVLFIGNSHTYLHHMPRMVERLATVDGSDRKVLTEQVTGEGVDLAWHWNNLSTRQHIQSAAWDYVVLQERSGGPLEAAKRMWEHARKLDGLIRSQEGRTVFYMTWAPRSKPQEQTEIAAAYQKIADELDSLIAPVGLAWQRVLNQRPDFLLYHRDGRHASVKGAYLTACVFYALIRQRSPVGLPDILPKSKGSLEPEDVAFLQQTAWEQIRHSFGGQWPT